MKFSAVILFAFMFSACAEMDPYKRLEPAPTPQLTEEGVADVFNNRWPESFKCVQTVTLDFGVQTRTLLGYLIVQRPDQFRLQGMSEQGLKLFDLACDEGNITKVFAAEEFDARVLDSIARDIRRVFLADAESETGALRTSLGVGGLVFATSELDVGESGTRAEIHGKHSDLDLNIVGDPPQVDWYDYRQSDRSLYRVDHYEWQEYGDLFLPSTIVLRERGIQSEGPAYKLTIKITEFAVRDKPWPDKVFKPEGE